MRRSDTTGSKRRGALIAGRLTARFLVEQWASAIAVLVGIVLLRRQRSSVATGAFTAIAIVVFGDLAALLIPGLDVLNTTAGLVLTALNAIEAAALVVAASMSMRRWS